MWWPSALAKVPDAPAAEAAATIPAQAAPSEPARDEPLHRR
jgi:hypothetical protein